jgi:hypothetical protein
MNDTIGDISSQLRGNAYNQNYGAMTGLTSQLAGLQGQYGLANQGLQGQYGLAGAGLAGQLGGQQASLSQQANLANQQADLARAGLGYQGQQIDLSAMGMTPNVLGNQCTAGGALQGLGGAQTAYDQAKINEEMQRYNFNQQAPWQNLNQYANIIQPGTGIGGTQTKDGEGSSALSNIGTAASTALTLAKLFAMSDRRLKTDIQPVGKLDNGLTVYKYRFKSGGPMQIGVMADEVEKVIPEAVGEIDGYKAVNYGML